MKRITLVIGGCKSGKSRHGLALAESVGSRKTFIATCVPFDAELSDRVARHKADRDASWRTVDVPVRLGEAVLAHAGQNDVLLIDCLTLWINNLLIDSENPAEIERQIGELAAVLPRVSCSVILVSNEVGAGIVPENRLARLFRDLAGFANQRIGEIADDVIYMVAGIPLQIKGGAGRGAGA